MNRKLTKEMEYDFFFVHDSIVYGVLKRLGVAYSHPDYDDYIQIGLISLVKAYEAFPKSLYTEEHFYQFTGFAYQKVRWAIIDELRKANRLKERETNLPEELNDWAIFPAVSDDDFLVWELLPSMLQCLSEKEQQYLLDAVMEQLSITAIAKKHGVSRKTVYRWKKKIAKKLAHYKSVLKH